MATLKNIFSFSLQNTKFLRNSISRNQLNIFSQNCFVYKNIQIRYISFYPLAKNLRYISNDKNLDISVDQKTMKLNKPIHKPLCYMFTWLNAKDHHIEKYANIYLEKGFDIFHVSCTPLQLMFPMWGTQPTVKNVLKFMDQNNSTLKPIVLHGFSVAGYMWGEMCKYASKDLVRYEPLFDQIECQTWDCVPDVPGFTTGIPRGFFPHNRFLQIISTCYAYLHQKIFYFTSTRHYNKSSEYLHKNLVKAPVLFLVSKADPVGTVAENMGFRRSWEKMGKKVTWKCWDDPPHVQIIQYYPKEYIEAINNHLKENVPSLKIK